MYNLSMQSGSESNKKALKRIRASIIKDGIHPADYNRFNLPFSCEDCSHFKTADESCTLGMPTEPHLKKNQINSYNLSGKIALCRIQEID